MGFLLALMVSCQSSVNHSPGWTANPYPDDYSGITPLSNRHQWGAANVHDPALLKVDSCYYVFSTDAYYMAPGVEFNPDSIAAGHIQIRKSNDLINWQFVGWVFDRVPDDAVAHVRQFNDGKGGDGIWAPYVVEHEGEYRLYYSVSGFGTNSSYIGMAKASNPQGPWSHEGCVVKTSPESVMNAIDASIVTDAQNGRMWMHYGSYFGGLHCVELDPATGLTLTPGDQGHLVATRANRTNQIIEAPEIIYHPDLKKYFLFVSYDPLFTHYNVRVGRSDHPQGPFLDFFGNDMADTTNNYPILTHSYRFNNHPGWSGNAHCGVMNDNGKFFMLHQGRLAPDNLMMVMQTRQMFWLPSGWPVVSPERYAGVYSAPISNDDVVGEWEVITLNELPDQVKLWQGQIPPGGWNYNDKMFNLSQKVVMTDAGTLTDGLSGQWTLTGDVLKMNQMECVVFRGWDWENQKESILFSGLNEKGVAVWGKKVNLTNKN
ncbi:MAG: arabinan endo-1,5-alpha-L-arabinosidase [Marinilabiliaceae bacterium]|nr:arabinan endo-1,5-alpha-L-arabinosidase [Marinilabiliaceae bacterium]